MQLNFVRFGQMLISDNGLALFKCPTPQPPVAKKKSLSGSHKPANILYIFRSLAKLARLCFTPLNSCFTQKIAFNIFHVITISQCCLNTHPSCFYSKCPGQLLPASSSKEASSHPCSLFPTCIHIVNCVFILTISKGDIAFATNLIFKFSNMVEFFGPHYSRIH